MPDTAETPAGGADAPRPADASPGSPQPVPAPITEKITPGGLLALVVSLAFVAGALYTSDFGRHPVPMTNLLFAAGVATVITTFGGISTLVGKSFVFAGTTAATFAIMYFLDPKDPSPGVSFVRGKISDIDSRTYDAKLALTDYVHSYLNSSLNHLRFVIFADEMDGNIATLQMRPIDGTELPTIRIPVTCLNAYVGKTAQIDWEFDAENLRVRDRGQGGRVVGGVLTDPDVKPCEEIAVDARGRPVFAGLVQSAHAQEDKNPAAKKARPLLPADKRKTAIDDLGSDNVELRRVARQMLSAGSPEDVPALMEKLAADESYRSRLGITVALTEMLRQDKALAPEVAAAMSPAGKAILVDLAGHPDRTMRLYATEFLYDLGDPETAALSLRKAAGATDTKAKYNWIFAARDGWTRMTQEQKAEVQPVLDEIVRESAGAPQTSELLQWYRK